MSKRFLLFDMDGVLLEPGGYHEALVNSVERIGKALGAPNTTISSEQIARFEVLNITNEWDTLAICTALTLIHLWQISKTIRLDGTLTEASPITKEPPDFDTFLNAIGTGGDLPGEVALQYLIKKHPWLSTDQLDHLGDLLTKCRDIYHSLTLPAHQETVLGSRTFEAHYNLKSQMNLESFLTKYDRPILTEQQYQNFREWLDHPDHHAGIMTNRPSRNPPGFLSSPEAELGIELIGFNDLPYVGSGILGWFAACHSQNQDFLFLKPNPVHTLTLLQRCLGKPMIESLQTAVSLWEGSGAFSDWEALDNGKVVIFEDSVKGLLSGQAACRLINALGIEIDYTLVGIAQNQMKINALAQVSTYNFNTINQINWFDIAK